jgi:hypothetical protein
VQVKRLRSYNSFILLVIAEITEKLTAEWILQILEWYAFNSNES